MSDSYLDLPYDIDGFSNAIKKFLQRDNLKKCYRIIFELPYEYRNVVDNYVHMQEDPKLQENLSNEQLYTYTCKTENKLFTFAISSNIKDLKIRVISPMDKKQKKKKSKL